MLPTHRGSWLASELSDLERVEGVKGRGNSTQYLIKLSSSDQPIWVKGQHMDRQDLVKEFQRRKNRERRAGQRQKTKVSSQLQEAASNTQSMYNFFPVVDRKNPLSQAQSNRFKQQQQQQQIQFQPHQHQQSQQQQPLQLQQQQQQQQQQQRFSQQSQQKKRSNIKAAVKDFYSQQEPLNQQDQYATSEHSVDMNEDIVPGGCSISADHRPSSDLNEQHATTLEWLARNQEYLCQQQDKAAAAPIEAATLAPSTPDLADSTCAVCREASFQENEMISSCCSHVTICTNCAHVLYLSLFAHECFSCKALVMFFLSTFSLSDLIRIQLNQDGHPLTD